MLMNDDAIAVDHEGLRHAGRTQLQLHLAGRVGSDPRIGIAPAVEEIGNILRRIAAGNRVDFYAGPLQLQQLRRFGDTGHTPADIEQRGLAPGKIGTGKSGPLLDRCGQGKFRHRFADHLALDDIILGHHQADRDRAKEKAEQHERQPEQPAVHSIASANSRCLRC